MGAVQYLHPSDFIRYDPQAIFTDLTQAKAQILALQAIPFQRRWVQDLQEIQLKMEVAGTSRIEGADFAGDELDEALAAGTTAELLTLSQRQANAAVKTYQWISSLPDDQPINMGLICDIHRRIVLGCDDDHCEPGRIRRADQNVTFGLPKHRGISGGRECAEGLECFTQEMSTRFRGHDPLIQALAVHYHFASMHPFIDGNGRTARALEALMLQRAGLKDSLFIAMSNFYYEEKDLYLATLATVRAQDHDLTDFLKFGLRGITKQTARLAGMIRHQVQKQIFRNLMHDLFTRLESTRKRVIVRRQLEILEQLLILDAAIELPNLVRKVRMKYGTRKNPAAALLRDVVRLQLLGAVRVEARRENGTVSTVVQVNLDWPTQITDTEFFARLEQLPKSKTHSFLALSEDT